MIDRSGILPKSPLVYSLASIRFAPWPLMSKKIDEIHDELREITPLIHRIQVQQAAPVGASAQVSESLAQSFWMLMSSDRKLGIQISPDQLLVFSRSYKRYANFEKILEKGLDVLLKHMRHIIDVSNMGVRYVDHVKTKSEENLELYISEKLLPPTFGHLNKIGGIVVSVYSAQDCELRIRSMTQPDMPAIPEDLLGLFAMAQEPGKPFSILPLAKGEMILDMDAVKVFPEARRMSKGEILGELRGLHNEANAFFRHEDVFTDHAFRVWKEEA